MKKENIDFSPSISKIFETTLNDAFYINYNKPSEYLEIMWNKYVLYKSNRNVNNNQPGKVFEKLIEILLRREGIVPFSIDRAVDDVPLVKPDILLITIQNSFIFISLKTSLRERWKQADWESIIFKRVHKTSKCYLVTLEYKECESLKKKINNNLLHGGLDKAFYGLSEDLDDLFLLIKKNVKNQ